MEAPKIKLTDSFKITVLICYLLNELGSLTEYQLTKILTLDETVNHFDLTEAFGILENKNLANFVEKKDERYYEINEDGRTVAAEVGSVPLSVREKSLLEGKKILNEIELRKTVSWKVQKREDAKGYNFNIRLLNEFGGKPTPSEHFIKSGKSATNEQFITSGQYATIEFSAVRGPDLMEINLYAPSKESALDIQRRFLERPLDIVRAIMTMFTTDMFRM